VAQQRLDGYAECIQHAIKRKTAFNKKVLDSKAGQVIFNKGQLVQIYRSDLTHTFRTDRKLLPRWSPPHRIMLRLQNSYKLETLEGTAVEGEVHARRLRPFTPREGTKLAEEQKKIEEKITEEQREAEEEEEAEVDEMRMQEAKVESEAEGERERRKEEERETEEWDERELDDEESENGE
jgi:hypothetical protein